MPRPVEALPCGSRSSTRVGSPTAASAVPRVIAEEGLPAPPFWVATTRTLGLLPAGMTKLPDLKHHAGGIAQARVLEGLHPPRFTYAGQFGHHSLTLEK